jgi:WD40 repeat protein
VAFSQDGKEVLSAGRDKAAHQWSVAEGKKQRELGGLGDILKLLPNGGQIYLAGSAKKLSQAGASDLKPGRGFEGGTDWIYSLTLDSNTQRLAAGSYDGNVTVWNLGDGKQVNRFNASPGYTPASQDSAKR